MASQSEKQLHWLTLLSGRWGAAAIHIRILRVYLTRFHGWLIHVMRGAFPGSRNHLVLRTTGRKTGKTRQVPLIYIEDGERYVVVASSGGFDLDPKWWLNLQANPGSDGRDPRQDDARPGGRSQRRGACAYLANLVDVYPLYDNYVARTARHIPVLLLSPTTYRVGERGSGLGVGPPVEATSFHPPTKTRKNRACTPALLRAPGGGVRVDYAGHSRKFASGRGRHRTAARMEATCPRGRLEKTPGECRALFVVSWAEVVRPVWLYPACFARASISSRVAWRQRSHSSDCCSSR